MMNMLVDCLVLHLSFMSFTYPMNDKWKIVQLNRMKCDIWSNATAQNQMSLTLIEKRCTCHVDPLSMQI